MGQTPPNQDEDLILDTVDRFLERDVRPQVRALEAARARAGVLGIECRTGKLALQAPGPSRV